MSQSVLKNVDLQITPIVAYGLVFMLIIFGYLGLEKLVRHNTSLAQKLVIERENLDVMQTIQASDVWENRLEQSIQIRQQANASLWPGRSAGVIAAQFQQDIRKIAETVKAKNIRVKVEAEPVSNNDIEMLAFEFSAALPFGDTVFEFLNALAQQQHLILIQDTNFSHSLRDKHPTRLVISGFIPIKIGASSPRKNKETRQQRSLEEIMP